MKERINTGNYEAWLLDRLEGNLTPDQEAMLDAFLAAHPELDPGHDDLPRLEQPHARLPRMTKDALKRGLPPMAAVNDANIDDHLIARLEGDLAPAAVEALRIYLLHHPEHRKAERLYDLTKLVPEAIAFAEKRTLGRELPPLGRPDRFNIDDFLIARLEGDLDVEQMKALEAFLSAHPEHQLAGRLYASSKVVPVPVVFEGKQGLKKGGKVVAIGAARTSWTPLLRRAAVVAVLIALGAWLMLRGPVDEERLAGRDEVHGTQEERTPDTDEQQNDAVKELVPEARQEAPVLAQEKSLPLPSSANGVQDEAERNTIAREVAPALLAVYRAGVRVDHDMTREPVAAVVPEVGISAWVDDALAEEQGTDILDVFAGLFRRRVLNEEAEELRPFDRDDAVAVVDKGLKKLGGEDAGLDVERNTSGRWRRFNLQLGPSLGVSASR